MYTHNDKKRKIDVFLLEDSPKSQVLKDLSLEEQKKYAKLDKYFENITLEELKSRHLYREDIMLLNPYDRILFRVFLDNIVYKYR
jgi:hypothetical protein